MSPDDPRHGHESGHEQHIRDGEPSCPACYEADLIASRRRSKRKQMGHKLTRPLGKRLHRKLTNLREQGARLDDIAEWAGINSGQVFRIIDAGPTGTVYARTWFAIHNMTPGRILTPVGIQRRMRALAWAGWSPTVIAKAAGVHPDTVIGSRNRGISLSQNTKERLAAVYEQFAMKEPPSETVVQRRAAGNVRSYARRNGYVSALCWDDDTIDDPRERPNLGRKREFRAKTELDHAIVERLIAGQQVEHSTRAERDEAMRRWKAAGRSEQSLCKIHGWGDSRYGRDMREAS